MNVLFIESAGSTAGIRTMATRTGHVHRGIIYETHRVTPENREALRNEVYPFEEQFGYPSRWLIHDKVTHYIQDGVEVTLARRPRTLIHCAWTVGIITEEIRRVPIGGERRKISSVGIRVVLPEFQGHGIGFHFLEASAVRNDPDAFTGNTRVPSILDIYQASPLIRSVAPINAPITDEIRAILRGILDKTTLDNTDLENGVYSGFPPSSASKEDLKRFNPSKNPRSIATRRKMDELGANPVAGKGVRYYAEVDHEAVAAARERGTALNTRLVYPTESVLKWVVRFVASLARERLPF